MTNHINLREVILEVLLSVTRDGEYSHLVLGNTLEKYQYLSKKERSFLTRVCEGTLEHMIWIDYVLNQFSKVKVNKMKPVIRTILRSSVYELKYMDGVPASATCNEAVKLVSKRGFGNLKGFVNGVLRNIHRGLAEIPMPDRETEPVSYLSIQYSMPAWIVQQWLLEYSMGQVEEILQSFLTKGPTAIRVNTARISREALVEVLEAEGIQVSMAESIPDGLFIENYDYLKAIDAFQQGFFSVQDISSMEVAHQAAPQKGDVVLDVCAAPGGKSIHIAELLQGTGMVIARDLTAYKVGLLQENIERCRLGNIQAQQKDAGIFYQEDQEIADIVVADLPCSGLGVMGKKKDIKYKMTPEKQKELVQLQRKILDTVCHYVKPGGTLLYSTCTIHRQENQENVSFFLENHPQFQLEFQKQILPMKGKQDGFFLAKLKRNL